MLCLHRPVTGQSLGSSLRRGLAAYLGLPLVPIRGHEVLEQLVHVKVILQCQVSGGKSEGRGLLENPGETQRCVERE
jgi:hypothetical protein